jgi:hypothetical protein
MPGKITPVFVKLTSPAFFVASDGSRSELSSRVWRLRPRPEEIGFRIAQRPPESGSEQEVEILIGPSDCETFESGGSYVDNQGVPRPTPDSQNTPKLTLHLALERD